MNLVYIYFSKLDDHLLTPHLFSGADPPLFLYIPTKLSSACHLKELQRTLICRKNLFQNAESLFICMLANSSHFFSLISLAKAFFFLATLFWKLWFCKVLLTAIEWTIIPVAFFNVCCQICRCNSGKWIHLLKDAKPLSDRFIDLCHF